MEKEATESNLKSAAELAAEKALSREELSEQDENTAILKKDIEELRQEAAKAKEHWDRLLRTQADLDNYRKRVTRERQDLIKTANERLLLELLTPLDHFEIGLQSAQNLPADDALRQGMEMVLAQFQQFLKSHHVSEIQAIGQKFDPSLHEAVAHQESDLPEGQVIQQIRKGYRLNDKPLRPATVIVSKEKSGSEENTGTQT